MKIAPVVAAVPTDTPRVIRTPAGRKGLVCPNETTKGKIQCNRCGLCLKPERETIILFRAHGPNWVVKKANKHLKVIQAQDERDFA